ncbi:hypothetical protein [Candidatus Poriferisodalis sp.]|uniref:hypothetical protein n=1 Tax=Candidatus Poriferisodalis sp. TaxID=3101277 RepID=UPI003B027D1C
MEFARPRVAAVGLDQERVDAIEPLCGTLHNVASWADYVERFSPFETDIAVMSAPHVARFPRAIHVLALAPRWLETHWHHPDTRGVTGKIALRSENSTEHQLWVPETCPEFYRELADDLVKSLWSDSDAPETIEATRDWEADPEHLVETTIRRPVALRYQRTHAGQGEGQPIITLALPFVDNLGAWFRSFLQDLHEISPGRVPTPPPRLLQPSDWYTPDQLRVARKIADIDSKIERMRRNRERLKDEMRVEAERAEAGVVRALWSDGDDLVEAVEELLAGIGFQVRNMDKEKSPSDANREDLRLTVPGDDTWEAIVEVKGYPNDTKSSDARQLREYRDLYREENERFPDLTLWITNPHRRRDPSTRPSPNPALDEVARVAETVHIRTVDLFPIWRDVAEDRMESMDAIRLIQSARPGTWISPAIGDEHRSQNDSTADGG